MLLPASFCDFHFLDQIPAPSVFNVQIDAERAVLCNCGTDDVLSVPLWREAFIVHAKAFRMLLVVKIVQDDDSVTFGVGTVCCAIGNFH